MPLESFDDHYNELRKDPHMAKLLDEESERLDIALALMKAREAAGLTQAQLATKSGISKMTINRIERGYKNPGLGTIRTLASAMGRRVSVSIQ